MKKIILALSLISSLSFAIAPNICPPFKGDGIVPEGTRVYSVSKDCSVMERTYSLLDSTYEYSSMSSVKCFATTFQIIKIHAPGQSIDNQIIAVDANDLM